MNAIVTNASSDLPDQLAARLTRPLPGAASWRAFSPELSYGRHAGPAPHSARHAAVLVLFYPRDGQWHLPLMLRPDNMVAHASQVSFPGGLMEGSETPEECAVREFVEEFGASALDIALVGRLSPIYIYGSNFQVTPCVGITRQTPVFSPNPVEVAELLEMPLQVLTDPSSFGHHERDRYGVKFRAPHIETCGHQIWGATCLILSELRATLLGR